MSNLSIDNCISLLAIMVSISALWLSYRNSRQIKPLQDLQIKLAAVSLENEQSHSAEMKKATIVATPVRVGKGKFCLDIVNQGPAVARNIQIAILPLNHLVPTTKLGSLFPIDLAAHDVYRLALDVDISTPSKHETTITWDDDFCDANQKQQNIDLAMVR